jgi:2-polyprenyl-3-methyl-5-hydroxy-6-metoxy-1,4-benzoquinol methylase
MINRYPHISNTGYWDGLGQPFHCCSNNLCNWIINYLNNEKDKQVWDFGCGTGQYLRKLQDAGFTKLGGFEGDPPQIREFSNIIKQDLSSTFDVPEKGNVIFLEVAEHIPSQFMDALLNNVANACNNKLISSWAIRGQNGHGHCNELNNNEAIDIITKKGFEFLPEDTKLARSSITNDDLLYFRNTLLIFRKI